MVKKLSMYVGSDDVYPTMDVNFSILTRECKNTKLVDKYFLFKICFVINVLKYKTIIALKLAWYRLILANSALGLVG